MSTTEPSLRRNRTARLVALVLFAIALSAPVAGMIAGYGGGVAAIEFRKPAPLPGIPASRAEIDSWPSEMDAFLEDHFGFRSQLLSLNSRLHVALGVSPTEKFVIGTDGWFYLRDIDHVLDQYRGVDRFSDEELETWVATMEEHQRWLAAREIRMLIAIAPMKQTIYPEHLPDWANVVDEERRYVQLVERLADGSSLEVVDLHGPLHRAAEENRVYHKTDGHWNQLGAHAAYVALIERIRETHPEVPLRGLDWFDVSWEREAVGTITHRLNIGMSTPEELPKLKPRSGTHVLRTEFPDGNPLGPLGVLHATQVIESDLPSRPKILLLRDSFANDLARFVPESFARTVLVHHGYGHFRRRLILEHEPDIVVYEMIERGLEWELQP